MEIKRRNLIVGDIRIYIYIYMYFWNSSHSLWNFARIGYKGFDHKYSFVGIRVIPLEDFDK